MNAAISTTWLGAYVQRIEIAGEEVWSVTTSRPGDDTRQRLFSDHPSACRYGLDQAEWHDLPFFDLAEAQAE